MSSPFLGELLKSLVTLGLAAASMFVGLPVAVLGSFWIYDFFLGGFYVECLYAAVLAFGAAGFIWWLSAMWLAWCGGRLKRFTLRRLFLAITLVAIYLGVLANLISGLQRDAVLRQTRPLPPSLIRNL